MKDHMHVYTYSVLRFIPDIRTEEFLNVGIAMHCAKANFAKSLCRNTVGRITKLNHDIEGYAVLRLLKSVQSNFEALTETLGSQLSVESIDSVEQLCKLAMPKDDSSLQWSEIGSGRCKNLDSELRRLYALFVTYADEDTRRLRRDEHEIWRSFSRELKDRNILNLLEEKTIYAEADEVKFDHAYKNGAWHCIQPISFDLLDPVNIKDKAHKWLGQLLSVEASADPFKLYFLVAEPQDESLNQSYQNAKEILSKAPTDTYLFEEDETDQLIERFESIIEASDH